MRLKPFLLVIWILPLAACATAPLPDDAAVVKPEASVPAEQAAFSGKWKGLWDGRIDSRLVVEEITSGKADVIYAWGQVGNVSPGWHRYEATLEGGTLKFNTSRPSTIRFKLRPDDTLDARYTWSGGLSKAIFTRMNEKQ